MLATFAVSGRRHSGGVALAEAWIWNESFLRALRLEERSGSLPFVLLVNVPYDSFVEQYPGEASESGSAVSAAVA